MNFNLGYNIFRFHYCKLCQIKLVILDQFYVWLRIPFYHKDRGDELFFDHLTVEGHRTLAESFTDWFKENIER